MVENTHRKWRKGHHTIRPNQTLHYLTPAENLELLLKEVMCH